MKQIQFIFSLLCIIFIFTGCSYSNLNDGEDYETCLMEARPVLEKQNLLEPAYASRISLTLNPEYISDLVLPEVVDWSDYMPMVRVQTVSCNAWASIYNAKTYYECREEGWNIAFDNHIFSPSWTYNQIRATHGDCNPYYHLKLVVEYGCDTLYGFPICDESVLPDEESYRRARRYKAREVRLLERDVEVMQAALKEGHVIVIGMWVYDDLDDITPENDTYDTIGPDETPRGYHWVCITGYNNAKKAFKCVNSWGKETYGTWKDEGDHSKGKGYFYLAYDLVEDTENPVGISKGGYILFDLENVDRPLLVPTNHIETIEEVSFFEPPQPLPIITTLTPISIIK